MAEFTYDCLTIDGHYVSGEISADNATDAKKLLMQQKPGASIMKLKRKWSLSLNLTTPSLSEKDRIFLIEELKSLLSSGIPLIEALQLVSSIGYRKNVAAIVDKVIDGVAKGLAFSESARRAKGFLRSDHLVLLEVAESTGRLDEMLGEIASLMSWEQELKILIKKSSRYPLIVFSFGIMAFIGTFTLLVPKFSQFFDSARVPLPPITLYMLAISDFMLNYGIWFAGAIVGSVLVALIAKKYRLFPAFFEWIWFHLPLSGSFFRTLVVARFSRILAMLYDTGIPLVNALNHIRFLYDYDTYQKDVSVLIENLKRGRSFGESLHKSTLFSGLTSQLVAIGERSSSLIVLLRKNSEVHLQKAKILVDRVFAYVEPVVIIMVGILMMLLAMGIFLPMIRMLTVISNS